MIGILQHRDFNFNQDLLRVFENGIIQILIGDTYENVKIFGNRCKIGRRLYCKYKLLWIGFNNEYKYNDTSWDIKCVGNYHYCNLKLVKNVNMNIKKIGDCKWCVDFKHNGRYYYVGSYDTLLQAKIIRTTINEDRDLYVEYKYNQLKNQNEIDIKRELLYMYKQLDL